MGGVGGWSETDNKAISVQLNLTGTATGTELGKNNLIFFKHLCEGSPKKEMILTHQGRLTLNPRKIRLQDGPFQDLLNLANQSAGCSHVAQ